MELLFESRLEIRGLEGKIYFVQATPSFHPNPVLLPSNYADGGGVSIYGSVLDDGGRLRLWYQAWPRDWDGGNAHLVGYAESDDGIAWRKPVLGLVEHGGEPNNLCNLSFHAPAIFVDPHAPFTHRYRATGWVAAGRAAAGGTTEETGYYTAHSADGLKWELDSPSPTWDGGDVITSIYHPGRDRGIVALKHSPRALHIPRRAVWTAELWDGAWTDEVCALVPDEYDDLAATSRGFVSGDYYGMGMMPAGQGTVGFLWQFRHTRPRTHSTGTGVFGAVDVTLVYQCAEGDRWLHSPGRPDFMRHGEFAWNEGGVYTSSGPVTVGDQQRLYFSGSLHSHGWYVDSQWHIRDRWRQDLIDAGLGRIGFAYWPKDRLFGYRADPEGVLTLDLGQIDEPRELVLNYKTEVGGSVRVALEDAPDRALADAVPLAGDCVAGVVAWRSGSRIIPQAGRRVTARIHIERADVYAYELR